MTDPDYKSFARWCVEEGAGRGCDLDGGTLQDMAEKFGVIKRVPYDPAVHGDNEFGLDPGDEWFEFVN